MERTCISEDVSHKEASPSVSTRTRFITATACKKAGITEISIRTLRKNTFFYPTSVIIGLRISPIEEEIAFCWEGPDSEGPFIDKHPYIGAVIGLTRPTVKQPLQCPVFLTDLSIIN